MRSLVMVAVAVGLMLLAGAAMAAQPGQAPSATLARLGLGEMHQMTDAEGQGIRGSGFVAVSGGSLAVFVGGNLTAGANPTYNTTGSTLTYGTSYSVAGVAIPSVFIGGVFSAGGSIAYAK